MDVAQLDRAPDSDSGGRGFESLHPHESFYSFFLKQSARRLKLSKKTQGRALCCIAAFSCALTTCHDFALQISWRYLSKPKAKDEFMQRKQKSRSRERKSALMRSIILMRSDDVPRFCFANIVAILLKAPFS